MFWLGSRAESLIYRRVVWPTMREAEDYACVVGGSLELSALSDLRASGKLDFAGAQIPNTHDLVRIYYRFTDERGETGTFPLATMFCGLSDPTHNCKDVAGSLDLESVLRVPLGRSYGMPYTVKAGTNAVAKAVDVIESLGLSTNKPASAYKLANDHVFGSDESYLSIANWLLDAAGFASCMPDAYGTVQMVPYVEPQERASTWTFDDGRYSIMQPEVIVSDNSESVYNACRLSYETEEESLWAATVNNDKNSPASIANRGYERTLTEQVSELSGSTQAERLANLKAQSKSKLVENSAGIEYVEWQHPYVPLSPNDAVSIEYSMAGIEWRGAVTNMQISLDVSMQCRTKARRFIRAGFVTETNGGSY